MHRPTVSTIETLTSEHAEGALALFHGLIPAPIWEGRKPSAADLVDWLDAAQDCLPAETLTVIDALQAEGNSALRGEAAMRLLQSFWENPALQPYVEQAFNRVHNAPVPLSPIVSAAFIVALAVLPMLEEANWTGKKELRIKWNPSERAAKLAGGIARLARAVPKLTLDNAIQSVEAPAVAPAPPPTSTWRIRPPISQRPGPILSAGAAPA